MTPLILKAALFAKDAHTGQLRKYTNEPYIVHPFAVAGLVYSTRQVTDEMIAAALLHDVVEDTGVSALLIESFFGPVVAELVESLTDVSTPEDGNRAARKAIDLAHTARSSPDAKTIKLADLIDNTRSIVACDPTFARIYMAEKRTLLEVLKEGDSMLYEIAYRQVMDYFDGGYDGTQTEPHPWP